MRLFVLTLIVLSATAARMAQAQTIINDDTYAGATLSVGSYDIVAGALFDGQALKPGLIVAGATVAITDGDFSNDLQAGLVVKSGIVNISGGTFNDVLGTGLSVKGGTVTVSGGDYTGLLNGITVAAGAKLNLVGTFTTVNGITTGVLADGEALPVINILTGGIVNFLGVPLVSYVTPSPIYAGLAFPLHINGTGFNAGETVTWNGAPLVVTSVTSTLITASVTLAINPPSEVVQQIPIKVTGTLGLNTSYTITVEPTQPYLSSVNPKVVYSGGPAFQVQALGNTYDTGAQVQVNGTTLPTTQPSDTELFATVPASYLTSNGTLEITVINASGSVSRQEPITVETNPGSSLTLLRLNTYSVKSGTSFSLEVAGTAFDTNGVINWNGTPLATTYVSSTHLIATVPASVNSAPGSFPITVTDGTVSNSLTITAN